MIPVRFIYVTGVAREVFSNARLLGSWDRAGRASAAWCDPVPMRKITADDGCPAFEAVVMFHPGEAGRDFRWGVLLDAPAGEDLWGIMTEVRDRESTDRIRTFVLRDPAGGEAQVERYHLNESRRLGANKRFVEGGGVAGIRFAVWAPNARAVDVVMGSVWDVNDPRRAPANESLPIEDIGGGYIADDHSGAHPDRDPLPMKGPDSEGVWTTDASRAELGAFERYSHVPYMFRVTRDDGSVAYRTDLYSRCQIGFGSLNPRGQPFSGRLAELDGTVSCSVVVDPDRVTRDYREEEERGGKRVSVWPEKHWIDAEEFWKEEFRPERSIPRRLEDLVIYELHLGALGFNKPGPGSITDALELLDYLEELGVNAIEMLPLSEFGGSAQNWGYATSHHFAIEFSGGGRDKYKFFIRECHRRGIAVIVDVVYNHFIHEAERAEWMYDSTSHERNIYYWYEGGQSAYPGFDAMVPASRRSHGGYVDNMSTAFAPRYWEEMVRKLFISSAIVLMEEFHVDGFRVDQTSSIHLYNRRHADGAPVPDANIFGQKFLRELCRTLKLLRPDIMLIAEDHSGWDKVTAAPEAGGLGFDSVWYADFYHHLIGDSDKGTDYARLLKIAGLGEDQPLAMGYFAGSLAASKLRRTVYHESHDEAGNGLYTKRTMVTAVNGAPLHGETRRFAEARCRFAFGMSMLSAGTPLFLFGEEVGAQKDFKYGEVLENREDLLGEKNGAGKSLFRFYGDLIRLRLREPALRSRDIDVLHASDENRVLAFRRSDGGRQMLVCASLNNHPFSGGYSFRSLEIAGHWREIFNSDSNLYGGDDIGNKGATIESRDGAITVVMPANGFIVLRKE